MLRGIGSRLTYANVTATLALFVALGGGAYAATSFVGSGGAIRACVAGNGSLNLVKPGKRCPKGKSAISWNQQGTPGVRGATGSPGAPGAKGDQGPGGDTGPQGPGAISINFHADYHTAGVLARVKGIEVRYRCNAEGFAGVTVGLRTEAGFSGPLLASGDMAVDGTLSSVQEAADPAVGVNSGGASTGNLDVIASQGPDKWSRFDLGTFNGGEAGCNFWGVIIPGT